MRQVGPENPGRQLHTYASAPVAMVLVVHKAPFKHGFDKQGSTAVRINKEERLDPRVFNI